jgi:predicted Fe-Mo cluster-binding NifX family protein
MIAIPIMRGRVAPVLNWSSRMLIFSATPGGAESQEIWLPEQGPEERLQLLREKGVHTVICGALSADLQYYATKLGLIVIPGVAGEVGQVLTAYREDRLSQPEFWLPGCQGYRRYRQGFGQDECLAGCKNQGGNQAMPGGTGGRGGGRGQGGGSGGPGGRGQKGIGGPGGSGSGAGVGMPGQCICPACGAKAPHERGIPCFQVKCPQCGKTMVRE